MKAVIDEPLGDIFDTEAGALLEPSQVDDAFMRDETARPRIRNGEMHREAFGDIVRIENGHDARLAQALGSHHGDVYP